ncbi:MAG: HAMP domain-containing histidine kinase [Lachnospiraceae bacterium]|jgi:nitrogen-specific signal transduction histidine kinase|nr:HAMP domain-containing histidine kinase [Lachnospiraceae bacterium]
MNRTEEGAFLFSGTDAGTLYVILTPVSFLDDTMYLFNLVPQTTVNQTTNQFVNSVILLLVILVIFIILLFAFYLRRAGRFNREIMTRERLFDILVSETKNGFMLLKVGREKPDYVSSNTETIFGNSLPKLESAGKGYRLSAGSGEKSMEALAMVNESLEKWDGSTEFISDYFPYRANGTDQYLRLCLYPVLSEKNEYVGIIQDMTRDYKRENSLRAALEMADSANHAKSRFLSGISHDIRTPLNAIINMTRFLQEEITQEKESQQLEIILRSSEHLLELINNVLDISRIESGKITFAEEPFSIGETADGVADIIRTLCDGKQQKFLYEKKNIRHQELIGDSLRLRQVLLNLLNNAVKYTGEKGCIRFTAEELNSIKPGTVVLPVYRAG